MAKNDLDQFIADRTKKNPHFPDMVFAAEERRALARELAAARKRLGTLSQTSIAAAMGTSPSIVIRLENGADVRLSTLQKYAAVLDCDLKVELVPKAS
jgi:hypothetical protein